MNIDQLEHSIANIDSPIDGMHLFYQKWVPAKCKRLVVYQHGFGEHCGRYQNLIDTLNDGHTAFYGMDARGHGRSGGQRGHVDDFHHYAMDLNALIKLAAGENEGIPLYLFGHSMGGVVCLDWAIESGNQELAKTLVVSAPALKVVMDPVKHVKKFVGNILASMAPSGSVEAGLEVKFISHDQSVVDHYIDDPLVHGKVSFRMGQHLFDFGQKVFDNAARISIPTYIFHGTGDGIVDPSGSQELYDKLNCEKKLELWPGLYHETINELPKDRDKVLAGVKEWIDNH